MLRKVAAGIYDYLPLGLRSIRKFENIVREEMNKAGAIELLMPAVLPAEYWKESGRWDVYGKELLRFNDRAEREYCIGPTHEEIITDIVRREVKSYKQLPVNLYQIQTKFRDEIRPRFGVMRAREFIMKDAYSFDATDEGADKSYWAMYEAYNRIFERCGLEFRAVLADAGNIGGSFSHEFMVLAETGEDVVMSCDKCDYAANLELAEIKQQDDKGLDNSENHKDIQEVHTPALKTVEEVAECLKVKSGDLIKTMIVEADGEPVAALVSGDKELSITKLRRHLGAELVELASVETIEKVTDGSVGFSGPVGLKIKIVADHLIKEIQNGVAGANKKDYHLVNVNLDKDYKVNEFADIRVAVDGDLCRGCDGGKLKSTRGIEVGHVFKLGTKYSEAMSANFVDEDGRQKPFIMGCYGIGIGRTVAAAIEQNFDDNGMILPRALAPFEISVLPLNMKDENVIKTADEIYRSLLEKGYDVLIDDRNESAGFKFKDADLIGVPVHVRIGPKTLKENSVEIRLRKSGETRLVKVDDAVSEVVSIIQSGMV